MNAAFAVGATLSLLSRFDPAKAIERHPPQSRDRVRRACPPCTAALLGVADQFPPEATATLRTCVSGGAALPVAVLERFRKGFRRGDPRGLWPVGDFARRVVQSPRRRAQCGFDRHTDRRGADAARRRERRAKSPTREPGEIQIKGPERDEGVLESARMPPLRRSRTAGSPPATSPGSTTDGYYYDRRPQERPDHSWRIQRLPARGRGGAARASRRRTRSWSSASRTNRWARKSAPRSC